jgi:hypothetical protein
MCRETQLTNLETHPVHISARSMTKSYHLNDGVHAARSTNRLKESSLLLSRCAQQLAVKVKYRSFILGDATIC